MKYETITFESTEIHAMVKFRMLILLSGLFISTSFVKSQNAVFDVTFGGFDATSEAAFNYATDIWSQYLISDVPIKVHVSLVTLLPGQLGITFPNGEKNFSGAPFADTWYASCLANAITGTELNTGYADMDIFLNSSANWYFGTDGLTPVGKYDFVSTVLHEICHGLGFLSLSNKDGSVGSFGLIYASDFSPLVTSFPWPELDTLPGAMDHFLSDGAGTALLTLANPSDTLGTVITSNNVFCTSPLVLAAHGGEGGRIYAPTTFTLGSSMSHWNEGTYPVGDENEFMTPNAASGHANHIPGPMTLALLEEIGWEIDKTLDITIAQSDKVAIQLYPNPSTDQFTIVGSPAGGFWRAYTLDGRMCAMGNDTTVNCSNWMRSVYMISIFSESGQLLSTTDLVIE